MESVKSIIGVKFEKMDLFHSLFPSNESFVKQAKNTFGRLVERYEAEDINVNFDMFKRYMLDTSLKDTIGSEDSCSSLKEFTEEQKKFFADVQDDMIGSLCDAQSVDVYIPSSEEKKEKEKISVPIVRYEDDGDHLEILVILGVEIENGWLESRDGLEVEEYIKRVKDGKKLVEGCMNHIIKDWREDYKVCVHLKGGSKDD